MTTTRTARPDGGAILPIVLVVTLVLALVVAGLADYASTTLRYGEVVEASADRLTAADGGMDHVLESLRRQSSGCDTAVGESASGYSYVFKDGHSSIPSVNGIDPIIRCRIVGGNAALIDSYAVILTGANGQSGALLTVTNGGGSPEAIKTFTGRIYMAEPPSATTITLNAKLRIKGGDLWYSDPGCPANGMATDLKSDPVVGPSLNWLSFTPAGRTTKCLIDGWDQLFLSKRPPQPTSGQLTDPVAFPDRLSTPSVPDDGYGCAIWEPGHYATAPALAHSSYNYFRSGDYFFDDVGTFNVEHTYVLAGYPGASGPSTVGTGPWDTANTNPCRFAWTSGDVSGATFYLGGNSHIEVGENGSIEISGRQQGDYFVGLQALDADVAPFASTLTGDDRILQANVGANKELSVQGTVWAPYTGIAFDTLANDAVGALTAGAVISELRAGAAANANGLLITVANQPGKALMLITSTATNTGTTVSQTIAEYRPTDGAVAVRTRRVIELTPE